MKNQSSVNNYSIENNGFEELGAEEIISMTGGSELTDNIWYAIGYTAGSIVSVWRSVTKTGGGSISASTSMI